MSIRIPGDRKFVQSDEKLTLERAEALLEVRQLPDGSEIPGLYDNFPGLPMPHGMPSLPPRPTLAEYVAQELGKKSGVASAEEIMNWWNSRVEVANKKETAREGILSIQNQARKALGLPQLD